jgi:integrase
MTNAAKPKKPRAEDMTAKELRDYIKALQPGEEFRVSEGVYIYRQTDAVLTYFVRIYYQKKHEYWGFYTQIDAEVFFTSRQAEIARCRKAGIDWDPEKDKKRAQLAAQQAEGMTIEEYGQWWYTNVVLLKNPHTTQRKYREYLDNHVYPYFDHGTRPMRSISISDLETFAWDFKTKLNARTGATLKVSTLHVVLRMLYGFFAKAVEKGFLDKTPFTKRINEIAGKKDPPKIIPLTPEQADTFLRGVRRYEPEWYPFFLTLLRTPLRTGEALALRPEDLDFDLRTIEVTRHLAEGKVLEKTKTKQIRSADMSEELAQELARYLQRREEEEQIRGIRFTYLFGWEPDRPIATRTIQELYNSIQTFLGLPHFVLYVTRHTVLSRLVEETKDLPYTQKQAGHASIKSTLGYIENAHRKKKLVDCLDTPTTPELAETPCAFTPARPEPTPTLPPPPLLIAEAGIDLLGTIKQYEREMINQALKKTAGNRQAAASLLGISYDTLLTKLRVVRRDEQKRRPDGDASNKASHP